MELKSTDQTTAVPLRRPGRARRLAAALMAMAGLMLSRYLWQYHGPAGEVEIYRGITYGCERMPETAESHGLIHWIRADLKVPGVSLYVTPLDPEARRDGYEYRLRYVSTAVRDEHLAAAINATLFGSASSFIRLPGDEATSNETVVADHVVNHIHPHSYLLWWDNNLLAHMELFKPPRAEALAAAKWAVAGQQVVLADGEVSIYAGRSVDQRTMVAADPQGRLVWIACFDKASYRYAAYALAEKGAKVGVMLDGGTSVAMAVGDQAKNIRAGVIAGNWRPVATQFGFRAEPLQ